MIFETNSSESFDHLVELRDTIVADGIRDAIIRPRTLRPFCVAYMDQIILTHNKAKAIERRIKPEYASVRKYLTAAGFQHITPVSIQKHVSVQNHIIKVKRFYGAPKLVQDVFVPWLEGNVKVFMPKLSPGLWKRLVENLWEIVNNGLSHGEGEFGVSACGQFYPDQGFMEVAFYDAGHGIPKRVRDAKVIGNTVSDADCIEWALKKGNTTNPLPAPGGLGLHLLQEFLKMNRGTFQIVSGFGYIGQCGGESPSPCALRNFVHGTLVNLRIIFDDALYRLEGESL